jgi:hypothetical protein
VTRPNALSRTLGRWPWRVVLEWRDALNGEWWELLLLNLLDSLAPLSTSSLFLLFLANNPSQQLYMAELKSVH